MFRRGPTACLLAGAALFIAFAAPPSAEVQLAEARNLGKAFYENPTTQKEAVDQFKRALDLNPKSAREQINYGLALLHNAKTAEGIQELEAAQKTDPSIPHTWFNLGIAYKRDAQYEKAITQFERMVRLVPDEPVSHYNLGVLYKLTGKDQGAVSEFETSSHLNPALAGPHFQLFNAFRQAGRADEATREQATFQEIKKRQAGAAVPEDLEWSYYAEIFDPLDAGSSQDAGPVQPLKLVASEIAKGFSPEGAGIVSVDIDGKGPSVIAWSPRGIKVLRGTESVAAGLDGVQDPVFVAPADFNNDGLTDLAIVTKAGASLWINKGGKFEKFADVASGHFTGAVWIDFDHDYDLDLVLLGEQSVLMRNNGTAGFSDETKLFPFVKGKALAGVLFDAVADTDGMDLVVSYADRAGVLYKDQFGGKYEARDVPAVEAGVASLAARDLNNDGSTDLVAAGAKGVSIVWNRKAGFEKGPEIASSSSFAIADLQGRGLADVVGAGKMLQARGAGVFEAGDVSVLSGAAVMAAIDGDDGSHAIAVICHDGTLQLLRNQAAPPNWIAVSLTGVRNPKLAYGAKVELRSGTLYQKRTYYGQPISFGLRARSEAESVRITWPNGLIQNQIHQAAGKAYAYKEAQRLSGSCPMIFTWTGQAFQFLTDVLGVAPLGASAGNGNYFPVDHDEYVMIPGEKMQVRAGQYEVRITEELREVSYIDRIQLIAVDHAASVDVFSNDKFKSPPFPEFRMFGAEKRVYPVTARDARGLDVRGTLLHSDRIYAGNFSRDLTGVAEVHNLDLDFGTAAQSNKGVLILSGWVDWADGSTFLAASQASKEGLIMPYLQVRDQQGHWKTVIEDMGIPAGKPKTIAIDLTGKFLSASREVRIVTNLCVYWDEIFLSENSAAPEVTMTGVDAHSADLHYRGFSQPVIDSERVQPEQFLYNSLSPSLQWNPTAGNYTRFGDVRELLTAMDDKMVIMGSGDEMTLLFDPMRFPALKAGQKRDFLLLVDGWAKDADANTAFGRSVEPLPFHAMSAYPYGSAEHYPDDSAHEAYRRTYNTRPALRLLRPLH